MIEENIKRRCGGAQKDQSSSPTPATIDDIIPFDSVETIAKQLLEAEHFFRLTIDLKKIKFLPPLQSRVEKDDDFVASVSLSYLTAPLFQSSDVFHAVQISRNPKDPCELLISDGFCSFRFEDKLHWGEFAKLFLPSKPIIEGAQSMCGNGGGLSENGGATLPIFIRARQCPNERKSTTIGVASLTFESFLSSRPPTLDQIPQSFYTNLVMGCEPPKQSPPTSMAAEQSPNSGSTPLLRELPIFEGLMRIPIITRESAAIVGMLTLGVAVDLMISAAELGALLARTLRQVTPIYPMRPHKGSLPPEDEDECQGEENNNGAQLNQSNLSTILIRDEAFGTPSVSREHTLDHPNDKQLHAPPPPMVQRRLHTISGLSNKRQKDSTQNSSFSFGRLAADNRGTHVNGGRKSSRRRESHSSSSGGGDDIDDSQDSAFLRRAASSLKILGGSGGTQTATTDQLLQCEIMLMKLAAEQQHTKFREEVRLLERKAEDKVNEIKAENKKLKTENEAMEKKMSELERKISDLQKSLPFETSSPSRCRRRSRYECASNAGGHRTAAERSVSCDPTKDKVDELRRQNDQLIQLLLRQQISPFSNLESRPTAYDSTFVTEPAVDTYGMERHVGRSPVYTSITSRRTAPPRPLTADRDMSPLGRPAIWGSLQLETPQVETSRLSRQLSFNHVLPCAPHSALSAAVPQSRLPHAQRTGRLLPPRGGSTTAKDARVSSLLARDSKGIRSTSPLKGSKSTARAEHRSLLTEASAGGRDCGGGGSTSRRGKKHHEHQQPLQLSEDSSVSEGGGGRSGQGGGAAKVGRLTTKESGGGQRRMTKRRARSTSTSSISSSPLSSRSRQLIAEHLKKARTPPPSKSK